MYSIDKSKTVAELFRDVASREEEGIALRFRGNSISYGELDERSERLAELITAQGVKPGSVGAIIGSRAPELIVAMLALIKAGCAYLPIAPDSPEERTKYMLSDSDCPLILTNDDETMRRFGGSYALLDLRDPQLYRGEIKGTLPAGRPEDGIYLIYTSGSTGRPKGVLVSNANLVNLLAGFDYMELNSNDIFVHFLSFTFDASIIEIFPPLLHGLTLVLADPQHGHSPEYIKELIIIEDITVMTISTAIFNTFVDYDTSLLTPLRKLLFGGEAHSMAHVKRAFQLLGPGRMIHAYGPTETTVLATYHQINRLPEPGEELPIGRAVPGTELFVLADDSDELPEGCDGELYIGGAGVTLGYLKDEEKNRYHFLPHPDRKGERIYRTGDLVKENGSGELLFWGRRDGQVKVRGYRIELAELEAQIRASGLVKNVAALVVGEGDSKLLTACCIARGETLKRSDLLEYLHSMLPGYMVPTLLVEVESLPLTSNNKVDRRALAEIAAQHVGVKGGDAPLRLTKKEGILLPLLEKLLGCRVSSQADTFAELGGNSLNGLLIIKSFRQAGYNLDLPLLLKNPTIEEICAGSRLKQAESTALPLEEDCSVPLAHSQAQTVNLYDGICRALDNWYSPLLLFNAEGFKKEILERLAGLLVARHSALAGRFEVTQRKISGQRVNRAQSFQLLSYDLGALSEKEVAGAIEKKAAKLFEEGSVAKGPLFRLTLFKTATGDHLLLLVHQLVCDGFSLSLLLTHLAEGYQALARGDEPDFGPAGESFYSWCRRVESFRQKALKELPYWQGLGLEQIEQLPLDSLSENNLQADAGQLRMVIPPELNSRLEERMQQKGLVSFELVILYLIARAISGWSGLERLRVDLINNGRYALEGSNLADTVGAFAHDFPLVINNAAGGRDELLAGIARAYGEVPGSGAGFRMITELTEQGKGLFPERDLLCNYLGPMDALFNLPGIELSPYDLSSLVPGESVRDYNLLFNCYHLQGALIVDLDYNRLRFSTESVEVIKAGFLAAAEEL